jgi:hypothetical protein
MQTVLLAREMDRMMKWDGDSKHAVNIHFGKVHDDEDVFYLFLQKQKLETRQVLGYLDDLTLDDVLKSVLMATLKASVNRTLRDSYHNILSPRHSTQRQCNAAHLVAKPDIKYLCQGAHGIEPYNKYTRQGAQDGGPAAYLCTYLDNHGVKPEKVLTKAGLAGSDWDDPASVNALYVASTKFWPSTVHSDSDADVDSNADNYAAGAAASDDSD